MNETLLLKDGLSVTLRPLTTGDLDAILALQKKVIAALTAESFLQPLSEEEYRYILGGNGLMIGAFSGTDLIAFRAMLEPEPDDEEHLVKDACLPEEEWSRVLYSEISNVDPGFRGNGLQSILGNRLLDKIDSTRFCYIGTTVAPFNIASLKDKFFLGFRIVALKRKYGTLLRYILMKEVNRRTDSVDLERQIVEMGDIEGQQALLGAGWVGVGMIRKGENWHIVLERP